MFRDKHRKRGIEARYSVWLLRVKDGIHMKKLKGQTKVHYQRSIFFII